MFIPQHWCQQANIIYCHALKWSLNCGHVSERTFAQPSILHSPLTQITTFYIPVNIAMNTWFKKFSEIQFSASSLPDIRPSYCDAKGLIVRCGTFPEAPIGLFPSLTCSHTGGTEGFSRCGSLNCYTSWLFVLFNDIFKTLAKTVIHLLLNS